VTTVAGKGVLPETHPANLGASLQFRATQELVARADVVLAVGTELSETDFYAGTRLEMTGRLIRVDIDSSKLADHYAADVGIWGDARASLEALLQGLTSQEGSPGDPLARAESMADSVTQSDAPRGGVSHARWRTELGSAATHRDRIDSRFNAGMRACARVLAAVRAALPAEAAVFSDMTQVAYLGNYAFTVDRPGSWFHPSGYGTLGYALPAAMGALVAEPNRPVVALAGDFGFQFTLQELAGAVELQLPLPIVLWNNSALGQIRDDMVAAGIPPTGVIGHNPDFPALARAYGAHGERVGGPEQLTAAIIRTRPPRTHLVGSQRSGFQGAVSVGAEGESQ
jgi:5-guanidino-2-oxopentanoate decarboxylase